MQYIIWDRIESRPVGKPYSNVRRARARVDTLDNQYGAYRYSVKALNL